MTAMLLAVSGLSAQRTQHSLAMFMRGGTCQPKRCCMAVWWSFRESEEPGASAVKEAISEGGETGACMAGSEGQAD